MIDWTSVDVAAVRVSYPAPCKTDSARMSSGASSSTIKIVGIKPSPTGPRCSTPSQAPGSLLGSTSPVVRSLWRHRLLAHRPGAEFAEIIGKPLPRPRGFPFVGDRVEALAGLEGGL